MRKITLCFIVAALVCALPADAETFAFKQKKGDKQRTISTVNEEVLLNGESLYKTLILNRMASEITEVKNGDATHNALFTLAEERVSAENAGVPTTFHWSEEYKSIFSRDEKGKITIAPHYVMPSIRDVPLFPARDLRVGETWTAPGVEAHDLGPTFGIQELFLIPFTANYTYLGEKEWHGKMYQAFSVRYVTEKSAGDFFENDPRGRMLGSDSSGQVDMKPEHVFAQSEQTVFWDSQIGQPVAASEKFSLIFQMNDGNVYEFRGTAEAEIIESKTMDKEELSRDIEQSIKDLGIEDASVKIVDDGISISLENIQFDADSAYLRQSEKEKLDKISGILLKYAERDILVGGHAARAGGTAESRLRLSEERAGSVAAYLVKSNVRNKERIMVRGFGSERPVADNTTEEGKRKNRRVEITILEN